MGISPEEVLEHRRTKLGMFAKDTDDPFMRENMDYAKVLREEIEILSAVGK